MYASYFVMGNFVGDDGDSRFPAQFLDQGLATGLVFYIECSKSFTPPPIIDVYGLGLQFGEVPLASGYVYDIYVAIACESKGHHGSVICGFSLLECSINGDNDLREVIWLHVIRVV